MFTSLNQTI